ncbi:MAG: ATP-binding cassette domain-containing protein [Lachnospiraceae bacterium]|nr:ATP-binding cassette domain-containing protein [Lachnospiraceae bacterium]
MKLILSGISKSYSGKKILDQISFTVGEGEGLCLMGPSGCGKTTLFRILLGLESADEGTIEGICQDALSAVFQEDRLLENLSAVKNVSIVCKKTESEKEIRRQLCEILPEEALDKPVRQLSGGMKRRVVLVRAVMKKSDLVIMDEPFTGLDEITKKNVIAYLKKTMQGKTFLFSTHQEEEAILLGTKIYRLQ